VTGRARLRHGERRGELRKSAEDTASDRAGRGGVRNREGKKRRVPPIYACTTLSVSDYYYMPYPVADKRPSIWRLAA